MLYNTLAMNKWKERIKEPHVQTKSIEIKILKSIDRVAS